MLRLTEPMAGRTSDAQCAKPIGSTALHSGQPAARRIAASFACAYISKNRDVVPAGSSTDAAARSHAKSRGEHVTEVDDA